LPCRLLTQNEAGLSGQEKSSVVLMREAYGSGLLYIGQKVRGIRLTMNGQSFRPVRIACLIPGRTLVLLSACRTAKDTSYLELLHFDRRLNPRCLVGEVCVQVVNVNRRANFAMFSTKFFLRRHAECDRKAL